MRELFIDDNLKRKLSKLSKKDKTLYIAVMRKIEEILSSEQIDHFKNLKKPLQRFKRVHITGSHILIFKYIKAEEKVIFYDLDHRDKIYR